MAQPETQKEQEVRTLLEAQLQPEETLLACTSGKSLTNYHVGLTTERLLLLPVKGKQSPPKAITVRREHIKSIKWSRLTGALIIKFNKDDLQFKHTGVWKKRAKALIETYNQTTAPLEGKLNLTTPERLQQVQDFRRLELLNTAQETLDQAIQLDPLLVTDPGVVRVQQRLFEQGLALQVGGGFLFVTLFIVVGLTLLGGGRLNPIGIIILSLIGYHLWRKHPRWRVAAMLLAGVNALILGISFYQGDGVLGSLMWLAYVAAVVLVLTGESQRWRTLTSIGVYTIGHIGILAVLFILGIISNLS